MSTPEPGFPPAATGFADAWRRVLTDPHGFFADMPLAGGLGEPLTFLAVTVGIDAAGHLLTGFGTMGALGVFVAGLVRAFLLAAALTLVAQHLFDGPAGFEPTFRALAYASAPAVLFWLPHLGGLAALYAAYLLIRGLERVHSFDSTRAVLTLLIGLAMVGVVAGAALGHHHHWKRGL
jgi:hypothetical protein